MTTFGIRPAWLVCSLILAATALVLGVPSAMQAEERTLSTQAGTSGAVGSGATLIDSDQFADPGTLSVTLAQQAFPDGNIDEVVIARDDNFADALASGGMQGSRPLLLVPGQQDLPAVVAEEIERLGVSRAVVLGGTAAVGDTVITDLTRIGLGVERIFGPDRVSTAAEIAGHIAADTPVDTVILARAYGSSDNPTQAFADALGAGAMGAETGWPILLTDSLTLSSRTRDLIADGIEQVYIVGGTAAISDAVEREIAQLAQVDRIAGPNRFGTAVEIAKTLTDTSSDPAAAIPDDTVGGGWTLIEGTAEDAWVAGFAAASVSAVSDAPVLLGTEGELPAETQAHLIASEPLDPDGDGPVLLCIVSFETCEFGRRGSGLPPSPLIRVRPADGAIVGYGSDVLIAVDPIDLAAGRTLTVQGCLAAATPGGDGEVQIDAGGNVVLQVPPYGDTELCESRLRVTFENGESATVRRNFARPPGEVEPGNVRVTTLPVVADARPIPYPVVMRSSTSCDHNPVGVTNADDLILTGQLPRPSPTEDPYPLAPWAGMSGSSTVATDAECVVSIAPDSDGVTVEGYRVLLADDPGTVLLDGIGAQVPLVIQAVSPDGAGIVVQFFVSVAPEAVVDRSWPAPAQDVVRVWRLDDMAGTDCTPGSAAQDNGVQYFDVPASGACAVFGQNGSNQALVMYLGQPLNLLTNQFVTLARDAGPMAVWGDFPSASVDPTVPFPPGEECPGIPEDPTGLPGSDGVIPECP